MMCASDLISIWHACTARTDLLCRDGDAEKAAHTCKCVPLLCCSLSWTTPQERRSNRPTAPSWAPSPTHLHFIIFR
uniref:Uncharacterized protein n=1 Tax=Arundo donax TaxID=35708 RepID=A0A0A8YIF4_ARUDO